MTAKKITGYSIFFLFGLGTTYLLYVTGVLWTFLMLAGAVFGLLGLLFLAVWLIKDDEAIT